MPNTVLKATDKQAVYDDPTAWSDSRRGVGLRVDYDVEPFELSAESIVILPSWSAEAFEEFWAISPIVDGLPDKLQLWAAEEQDRGYIDLQISADGGATWLGWDGAAWDVAGGWTSFDNLNLHLAELPLTDPTNSLVIKVRLVRGDNNSEGPVFLGVRLAYSIMPGVFVEDPFRTMRRWLDANVRLRFRETFASDGSTIVDVQSVLKVSGVVSAYNLTADPTRTTDLASGVFTDTTVTLTSAPTTGNTIRVEWEGDPVVHLANADPDFWNEMDPHVPVLMVAVTSGTESKDASISGLAEDRTINLPLRKYWKEEAAKAMDYRLVASALCASEPLAIRLAGTSRDALEDVSDDHFLRSTMAGTDVELLELTSVFDDETNVREDLSVKTFSCIICMREWHGPVESDALAEEFILIGPEAL